MRFNLTSPQNLGVLKLVNQKKWVGLNPTHFLIVEFLTLPE